MGNFFFWVARSGYGGASVVAYVQTALPFLPGIHLLRKNYLAKHKLLADMEGFDLDSVQCYSESDRYSTELSATLYTQCPDLMLGRSESGILLLGVVSGFQIS